jgi:hypothetical protein
MKVEDTPLTNWGVLKEMELVKFTGHSRINGRI